MTKSETQTLQEAHQHFARTLNGEVWELLQKPDRSKSEDEGMLCAAYASCYYWLRAGTGLHHQRAEWLIARVCSELRLAESTLGHAARCLELTAEHGDQMKDFDRAYAYEGLARANALAGNQDEALKFIQLAEETGQAIGDMEDRRIFFGDLGTGNWHGLR